MTPKRAKEILDKANAIYPPIPLNDGVHQVGMTTQEKEEALTNGGNDDYDSNEWGGDSRVVHGLKVIAMQI